MKRHLIIATRGSKLALWQAEWVKSFLKSLYSDVEITLNIIKTTGDKITDVALAKIGGKGLFVKEIEEALLRREADIAVHSMKDVPSAFPEGLHLPVILQREIPLDAFISQKADLGFKHKKFLDLPKNAIVGTSSLRRSCQILHKRPDLNIVSLRGNLDTRIKKLDDGQFDAIILAAAGVKRLGWSDRITEILPLEICLPAVGQGAVGIECRIDDISVNKLIAPLNHEDTSLSVRAERACLKTLEGGCQVPIAVHATVYENSISIQGLVGSLTGQTIIKSSLTGDKHTPEALGIRLAQGLLSKGAKEILDQIYRPNI